MGLATGLNIHKVFIGADIVRKCSESNKIEVSQNAADKNSPLDCSPECPQEEYVYDYQYAGGDTAGQCSFPSE